MFARREKLLRNISSNKCDISQREGKLIRNLVCHRAASINQLFPRPVSHLVICTRDNHNNICAKLVGAPTGEIISFHNIVKVFSLKFPHLSLSRKNFQLFHHYCYELAFAGAVFPSNHVGNVLRCNQSDFCNHYLSLNPFETGGKTFECHVKTQSDQLWRRKSGPKSCLAVWVEQNIYFRCNLVCWNWQHWWHFCSECFDEKTDLISLFVLFKYENDNFSKIFF